MKKAKLTPTTNDMLHAGNGSMQLQMITPVQAAIPPLSPTTVEFPSIPLPPKVKRARKSREQTGNLNVKGSVDVKPLKIALIGTAPSSRMLAPYNDPSWTIWGCSPGNMAATLPRCDAWFEVHGTNLLEPENANYAPTYIAWMNGLKIPLYMQDQQVCPNAITIPKQELVNEFGPYFFTSSFAWMMAMAMKAGASEIALFGIDMASRDEYIIQRPGAYYFFIEGAKRGINMSAPYESDIFQPPGLYGYSDVTPYGRKLRARKTELQGRLGPMRQQRDQLAHDITYLEGALEDNDYSISIQGGVQDNSDISYLGKLIKQARETPKQDIATLPSGT